MIAIRKKSEPIGARILRFDVASNQERPVISDYPSLAAYLEQNPDLTELVISRCKLGAVPPLPRTLRKLQIYDCPQIEQLPDLPDTLTDLLLHATNLTALPPLPRLTELRIYFCPALTRLPELPDSLHYLMIDSCPELSEMPPLPSSLTDLLLYRCPRLRCPPVPSSVTYRRFIRLDVVGTGKTRFRTLGQE